MIIQFACQWLRGGNFSVIEISERSVFNQQKKEDKRILFSFLIFGLGFTLLIKNSKNNENNFKKNKRCG